MMKTRSRYYTHFDLITPEEHQQHQRYWLRKVPPTRSTLSIQGNAEGKALFEAAVQRSGPPWEGACFCPLIRGQRCWQDNINAYDCGFHGRSNWWLHIFD